MEPATESINTAFAKDFKLRKRIFDAINETPKYLPLFHDIANHQILSSQTSDVSNNTSSQPITEQPAKKRKLEDGTARVEQERHVILEARDLSFTLPQRKKLHLDIIQYGSSFDSPTTSFALCVRNPATNQIEIEVPVKEIAYALRLPIPEKAQKQYNFCCLPPTHVSTPGALAAGEGIVWTVNHGALKSCQINSSELQTIVGTEDVLEKALNAVLQRTENKLILPDEKEFASATPEAHRKNEKAYHVKAHRGSKDGYLFFLENGIFFGFKKPLAFFPFHDIESVSYTAVLQRTFNLIITTRTEAAAEAQEIEFAMIDQADFAGIDEYIKNHQLQDASLADARRAKQYKVNGKGADQNGADGGPSELQKAEAEMAEDEEDEEDALEEDYDPGSDGDSEDSGSSDDEDENYDGEERNLVADELGSEAEDVSVDEEEEDKEVDVEEEEEEEKEEEEEIKPTMPKHAPEPRIQSHTPSIPIHPAGAPNLDDEDQL